MPVKLGAQDGDGHAKSITGPEVSHGHGRRCRAQKNLQRCNTRKLQCVLMVSLGELNEYFIRKT